MSTRLSKSQSLQTVGREKILDVSTPIDHFIDEENKSSFKWFIKVPWMVRDRTRELELNISICSLLE